MRDARRLSDRWMSDSRPDRCFVCWDENGYFPDRSNIPEALQLLTVGLYTHSSIEMDGMKEYFFSSIGVFAPEAAKFYGIVGFSHAESQLQNAMDLFGANYPRDVHLRMAQRREFVERSLTDIEGLFWGSLTDAGHEFDCGQFLDAVDIFLSRNWDYEFGEAT